jgi:glycosyltransferase involved in cell wall biosynthesis
MKKILVIHTNYQNTGGEDIAVKNEVSFLKKNFIVDEIFFQNKIDNYFTQFLYFLLNKNFKSLRIVDAKIKSFQPDIVYVHNTWFKASPEIFKLLKKTNSQIFLKLHNYRFFCTKFLFAKEHFKDHYPCKACGSDLRKQSLFNRYYKSSYVKSILLIIYGRKYFKILKDEKIKILCLNEYQKKFLINQGIPSEKLFTHINYLDPGSFNVYNPSSNYLVYAGRISNEKGVEDLIKSFLLSNSKKISLKIIGDGPELNKLKEKYINENILFLGKLSNSETINIIKNSRAVVTATRLLEVQPTLLCEASINSIPSIFPDNGGISEYFPENYGLKFDPEKNDDLIKKINATQSERDMKDTSKSVNSYITELLNSSNYLENFMEIIHEG